MNVTQLRDLLSKLLLEGKLDPHANVMLKDPESAVGMTFADFWIVERNQFILGYLTDDL